MDTPTPLAASAVTDDAPRPASELLSDLLDAFPHERVSVAELIDRLDARAHGVLLLVLALPMCIPNVPGISTIFGVLMMAPALQLVLGSRRLWLPRRVRAWTFPRAGLTRTLRRAIPALRRVEYLIRPRISFLTSFPVTILVGLQTLLMAFILILPVFGANFPPGVTVVVTALALLQRDGVLMLLSVPLAAGSVIALIYFGILSLAVLNGAIGWIQTLLAGFG